MAKKTKDSNLSLEEKLEQALIPNWDEPYKLPENWCWTNLGTLCEIINGFAFKSNKFSDTNGTPVIRITNIKDGYIDLENSVFTIEENINEKFIVCQGDLLVAMSGATTGKNGVYRENKRAFLNQRVGNIKIINTNVLTPELRNYYIAYMQDEILKSAYGGAQPNISSEKICQFPFALPPLAEQKRISNLLEKLFAKLDEAKEKAQEVVDGFETRKAAILHKAFSGELTAKWREENGGEFTGYKKRRFDEVAAIRSNLVDPAEYQNYPHIAPDNIEKKTGVLLEYRTIAEDGVKSGKHRFYSGQILYSKIRPNLSKVIVVDFDGLCSADMYPIEAFEDTRCLWYFMLSENFLEQASSAGSRSVLPKINQRELSALVVTIPDSIDEQQEIARIIDSLFAKEYQIKESAEAVIEQIDTMKKAILARAFRGELGTNDPSEESAVELVKKILCQDAVSQNSTKKPAKRITIPADIKELLSNVREEAIIKLLLKSVSHPVSIQEIMALSSKKFELMESLRTLEKKQLITKNESGEYSLMG